MQTASNFDKRKFRSALGTFTTGVTIVTTRAQDGTPVGLTANSFSSVSLDPPMILWSLAKRSRCLPAFESGEHWAVHILSHRQEELSNRFGRAGEDKFDQVETERGAGGVPLLPNCAARMQCKTAFKYEGGDHIIFVGEVLEFDRSDVAPLVFQSGEYVVALRKGGRAISAGAYVSDERLNFSENFINYLLGRAYYQFLAPIRKDLANLTLSEDDYYILAVLLIKDGRTVSEINAMNSYTGHEATPELIQSLRRRGLLHAESQQEFGGCFLTDKAREAILNVLAAAKAREEHIFEQLGHGESISLKNALKNFIVQTDPGLPDPWSD
ncbi:flavin reductase [Mesorhizobium sp. Root172]|jgi:3-hydroxy-9,10-secoandrosta-1,3,5(10)-triene-9,17-dione monooxygenase reductase component|uniref:flavin reductase n=1 Tax=Mesorhizobium sp. Root172 TaxID=1736481 RepID=UPI0006FE6B8A|nr:flavin reductase [Mesorhizobium sp. Root172]KRB29695.1 peptidase [Mesorhizobium sp. Root172]